MALTKTKFKNFMFDFDGTLIDSSKDVSRILIDSINKFGGNLNSNTKIKLGPPLIDMITSVVPHLSMGKKQKILEEYRKVYEKDELSFTEPYKGIVELLKYLKLNNFNVFIVTYKPRNLAMGLLNKYFSDLYLDIFTPSEMGKFSQGKTKSDLINLLLKKWQINPEESIMIGDASSDIICAKRVGLSAIGAAYGYGELNEFNFADKVVHSVKELQEYIIELTKE